MLFILELAYLGGMIIGFSFIVVILGESSRQIINISDGPKMSRILFVQSSISRNGHDLIKYKVDILWIKFITPLL